jgi:hypothetical protein
MTAEIVIMNKTAVALAADSKVTISGSIGKTFDTVNKVFTLSKIHPVGLMIYGNAEFMRCPWETIVKIYRSKKKAASFPTIADWGGILWILRVRSILFLLKSLQKICAV